MLTPGTPIGSYRLAWSRDTALSLPEDAKAAAEALRVARETQNWAPLIAPGSKPTWFVMRAIPHATMQRWEDMKRANGGPVGPNESMFSLFLIALMSIENFGEFEFARVQDDKLRDKRAPEGVLDALKSAGVPLDHLVLELALAIYAQETTTHPKS